MISSEVQFFFFVERKANSTIELEKCKIQEKREMLLVSKAEFNYQIFQRNENLLIDPVFSNWVNFIKKAHHKLFLKCKEF